MDDRERDWREAPEGSASTIVLSLAFFEVIQPSSTYSDESEAFLDQR